MAVFKYKAKDSSGKIKEGVVMASDRDEAGEKIKSQQLSPVSVQMVEKGIGDKKKGMVLFQKKVGLVDKANFCRYMSTMIGAGLSLTESMEVLSEGNPNPRMKEVLTEVQSQVQSGQTMSSAFARFPDVFDEIFITLIKAGEESGTLGKSFEYLGKQLYSDYELSRKVKSTLAYPAVIVTATGGLGAAMLVFVVPKIAPILLRMSNDFPLPIYTVKILEAGMFFSENILAFGIGILVSIIAAIIAIRQQKVKKFLGDFFSRVPFFGKLFTQLALGRFNRTLSTLLKSGVAITDSLQVAVNTLNLPQFKNVKDIFVKDIQKGVGLAEILRKTKVFPSMMCRMVATGEKTGALGKMLEELASFYEEEVANSLKTLTSVIEPVLMLVIGLGVGGMVVSVIAPIYSFVGSLSGGLGGGAP